jgi:hypothetical protein
MSPGIRLEPLSDWVRAQRFYVRIPIGLILIALISLVIYWRATQPLGYSYGETAFWFIVFALAVDRLRLIVESYKNNY